MTIPSRLAGPAILAAAFALNAFCNHTEAGAALRQLPGFYPVVFFVGIAMARGVYVECGVTDECGPPRLPAGES